MDGHISKPIDIDKLKREITSTLTKKVKIIKNGGILISGL